MNIRDLMVGDLVRVNRDGLCIKKGTIVVIRGIDANDRLDERGLIGSAHCRPLDDDQFEGGIWCEYLDPLPLTPEILEKNGAKHSVYERPDFDYEPTEEELNDALQYYPFHCYNLGTNIHVAFYPKEIRVEVFGQDFVDMFKIRGRKGDVYVHELQHALRLCGIEKEITI